MALRSSRRRCDACWCETNPPDSIASAFIVGVIEGARGEARFCELHTKELESAIEKMLAGERRSPAAQEWGAALVREVKAGQAS